MQVGRLLSIKKERKYGGSKVASVPLKGTELRYFKVKIKVFLTILLDDGRIRIWVERTKNLRIRITDKRSGLLLKGSTEMSALCSQ